MYFHLVACGINPDVKPLQALDLFMFSRGNPSYAQAVTLEDARQVCSSNGQRMHLLSGCQPRHTSTYTIRFQIFGPH